MHTKTLLFATLAVTARILAQEIENEDVPSQCRDICANTLAVSDRCNSGDDDVELNCICTSPSAMSDIPNCEACVAEYDESDNSMSSLRSFRMTRWLQNANAIQMSAILLDRAPSL